MYFLYQSTHALVLVVQNNYLLFYGSSQRCLSVKRNRHLQLMLLRKLRRNVALSTFIITKVRFKVRNPYHTFCEELRCLIRRKSDKKI